MITRNFLRSVSLLCRRHEKYYAKRYVHRQLVSRMFPPFGAAVTSSCASATGSLSQKACQLCLRDDSPLDYSHLTINFDLIFIRFSVTIIYTVELTIRPQ